MTAPAGVHVSPARTTLPGGWVAHLTVTADRRLEGALQVSFTIGAGAAALRVPRIAGDDEGWYFLPAD